MAQLRLFDVNKSGKLIYFLFSISSLAYLFLDGDGISQMNSQLSDVNEGILIR